MGNQLLGFLAHVDLHAACVSPRPAVWPCSAGCGVWSLGMAACATCVRLGHARGAACWLPPGKLGCKREGASTGSAAMLVWQLVKEHSPPGVFVLLGAHCLPA